LYNFCYTTGSGQMGLRRGLSRMSGNAHVRFLGDCALQAHEIL